MLFSVVAAEVAGGGSGIFLERDLQEIRALRQQLEVSIKRNDKLREQLDRNMAGGSSATGLLKHVLQRLLFLYSV